MKHPLARTAQFILVLATAALLVFIGYLCLRPIDIESLKPNVDPAKNFSDSLQRIEQLRVQSPRDLAPTGKTILMHHGQRTERVIVFLHGFTSSPRQFQALGQQFYQRGYNVYIPRIPHHGRMDQMRSALAQLTAEKLVAAADSAVNIAHGLGEHVTVVGLSMGGAMTAWVAQWRTDLERAVMIAPNLGTARIPNVFFKPSINYFLLGADRFIWWDSELRSSLKRPTGTYQGFPSKAFGEVRRLAWSVLQTSAIKKPQAQSLLVITNANDQAVSANGVNNVVDHWQQHQVVVERFEFPADEQLGHDLIDPEQPNQNTASVYPRLIELIESPVGKK